MKLTYRQIDAFVKAPNRAARVILVYGPDSGLVRERAAIIGKSIVEDLNDPFNVACLSAGMLAEDPPLLGDEAGAISMMGGDRLIRIEEGGDKLTVIIKAYLENPCDNSLVVVQAGELGPRSSLRKLCESADNAAALPCYVEDERNVAQFIRNRINEEQIRIDPDAVTWLAANISGDRSKVRSELEKLITYKGTNESTPISLTDAQAACGAPAEQSFDNLVFATASRKSAEALNAYNTLMQEGVSFVAIIRGMQNHFRRLHMTKSYMQNGLGTDIAMKKLAPPVFYKVQPQFKAQLNGWSMETLDNILGKLSELEAQCKQTNSPVETLCAQAILSISKMRV